MSDRGEVSEALDALQALRHSMMAVNWAGWSELDLTLHQLKALHFLSEEAGLTVGGLAECLGTKLPAASLQAEHLVRAGLVERSEDPDDRRRVRLVLTPKGEELASRPGQMRERLEQWLSELAPADLTALTRGLRALAAVSERESARTSRPRRRDAHAADPARAL